MNAAVGAWAGYVYSDTEAKLSSVTGKMCATIAVSAVGAFVLCSFAGIIFVRVRNSLTVLRDQLARAAQIDLTREFAIQGKDEFAELEGMVKEPLSSIRASLQAVVPVV